MASDSGERFSGPAIGAIAAGVLLVFAGIKGYSLATTVQNLIKGTSPLTQTQVNPITGTPVSATIDTTGLPGTGSSGGTGGGTGGTTAPTGPGLKPAGTTGTTGSVSTGLGSYSHAQLEALWIMAGGSPGAANNAACHAIQESSGNPKVTSHNPDGGTNVGLWQLDTPGGKGAGYSIAELQNPLTNARVAIKGSSNGSNWSAWATPGC